VLALAVGCRPFQIVYFPLLLWLAILSEHREIRIPSANAGWQTLLGPLRYFLLPLLVGSLFGWYNWVRFGNPLEFGHNHLPEFLQSSMGQFSWKYIPENFTNIFRLPHFNDNGILSFEKFNGTLFFLVNPIYLIFFLKLRHRQKELICFNLLLFTLIILHVLLILCHKTLGGWHFGNRYFIDMIPALLLFIRMNRPPAEVSDVIISLFGIALNIYGTLWLFLNWP
jgi:hypothetical protein